MSIISEAIEIAHGISSNAPKEWLPPSEGTESVGEAIIYKPLVKNTRGYIEKIANQINGTYEKGWYDACAVMIRRLIETLIIEVFESKKAEEKIKSNDNYMYLRDMIRITLAESSLNLSRNTKSALPRLKNIGDTSAHSRRYLAIRHDIDEIKPELRIVIQELLFISNIKK